MFSTEILERYPSLKKFVPGFETESHDGREEALLSHIRLHASYAQMKNNPSLILKTMDDYAAQQDFLINIGPHKGQIVADVIAARRPRVLVELGGYVGYSAIWFAEVMRSALSPAEGAEAAEAKPPGPTAGTAGEAIHLWSLEYSPSFAAIARELIDLAGLTPFITVVVGEAGSSLRQLVEEGKLKPKQVDLLFLDHIEDLYKPDFDIAFRELGLLGPGAVVVADNVVTPGAPEYREYVQGLQGVESKGVKGLIVPGEIEDELEITTVL